MRLLSVVCFSGRAGISLDPRKSVLESALERGGRRQRKEPGANTVGLARSMIEGPIQTREFSYGDEKRGTGAVDEVPAIGYLNGVEQRH